MNAPPLKFLQMFVLPPQRYRSRLNRDGGFTEDVIFTFKLYLQELHANLREMAPIPHRRRVRLLGMRKKSQCSSEGKENLSKISWRGLMSKEELAWYSHAKLIER